MKKFLMLLAAMLLTMALTACGRQEDTGKVVYIPLWMEPYSVVYYDADLNRTIAEGGDLTEEEIDSLEEASALRDIAHMPARVKCAVLGWRTLKEALCPEEKAQS